MTCQYIKDLLDKGAKLIDVRTEAEFAAGNIKDSINIPLSTFEMIDAVISKDENILLYCRSGSRSEMAKNYLAQKGYSVTNVGGINQYVGCLA